MAAICGTCENKKVGHHQRDNTLHHKKKEQQLNWTRRVNEIQAFSTNNVTPDAAGYIKSTNV